MSFTKLFETVTSSDVFQRENPAEKCCQEKLFVLSTGKEW